MTRHEIFDEAFIEGLDVFLKVVESDYMAVHRWIAAQIVGYQMDT